MLNDLLEWAKKHFRRKFTVPFHIAGSMICAFLYHYYPGLAIALFIAFGLFELWQEDAEDDMGFLDFWDYLFGVFLGAIILLIINIVR